MGQTKLQTWLVIFQNIDNGNVVGCTARYIRQVVRSHMGSYFARHRNSFCKIQKRLSSANNMEVMPRSTLSLNLNTIEYMWHQIQGRLNELKPRPTTADLNEGRSRPTTAALNEGKSRPTTAALNEDKPTPTTAALNEVKPRPRTAAVNEGKPRPTTAAEFDEGFGSYYCSFHKPPRSCNVQEVCCYR